MAKDYAYDYTAFYASAQPAAYPQREEHLQEHAVPKIKRNVKTKRRYSTNQILSIIVIVAVFIVVFRYTLINEMNYNNAKLTKDLHAVTAQTDVARINLDRTTDLKYVENVARTKLGMDFPQNHQVVSVTLSHADKAVSSANQSGHFFDAVGNIFASVLEYLH